MFATILGIILAVVVVLAIVIALQPADFKYTRSITISAPPTAVFAQVNDFHNWRAWSPWEKMDPSLQRNYEGPPAGVGTMYHWIGNNKVGEGKMTLTESRPSELIRIKLEFLKPFKATNEAEFTFQPTGDHTLVTWSMNGCKNFMMKGFGLFMNMDKMVGGQFEEGLANLKSVAEAKKV